MVGGGESRDDVADETGETRRHRIAFADVPDKCDPGTFQDARGRVAPQKLTRILYDNLAADGRIQVIVVRIRPG